MQKLGKSAITSGLLASIVAVVYLTTRNWGKYAGLSRRN